MADPDISDQEFDADDLLLMPIIIPQFDLQAEFPDLDSEDSEGEDLENLFQLNFIKIEAYMKPSNL